MSSPAANLSSILQPRTRPVVDLRAMLHPTNPYEGFDASAYAYDPQGWNGDSPLFDRLIEELNPGLTVEVGSWKGMSAIHMATKMAQQRGDAQLLCVDTWLGSFDWWLNPSKPPLTDMGLVNGYPTLYYQFLANIVHAGLQDVVVPFPATSTIAARLLLLRGVKADLIYIDASHEHNDVYSDMAYYWHTLREGGVMFGDDYRAEYYPGVVQAVAEFTEQHGVEAEIVDGQFWLLRKPVS
ncbi:MAG: class I SAM-dependent methyltransferase [Planctomycetota bacterium]